MSTTTEAPVTELVNADMYICPSPEKSLRQLASKFAQTIDKNPSLWVNMIQSIQQYSSSSYGHAQLPSLLYIQTMKQTIASVAGVSTYSKNTNDYPHKLWVRLGNTWASLKNDPMQMMEIRTMSDQVYNGIGIDATMHQAILDACRQAAVNPTLLNYFDVDMFMIQCELMARLILHTNEVMSKLIHTLPHIAVAGMRDDILEELMVGKDIPVSPYKTYTAASGKTKHLAPIPFCGGPTKLHDYFMKTRHLLDTQFAPGTPSSKRLSMAIVAVTIIGYTQSAEFQLYGRSQYLRPGFAINDVLKNIVATPDEARTRCKKLIKSLTGGAKLPTPSVFISSILTPFVEHATKDCTTLFIPGYASTNQPMLTACADFIEVVTAMAAATKDSPSSLLVKEQQKIIYQMYYHLLSTIQLSSQKEFDNIARKSIVTDIPESLVKILAALQPYPDGACCIDDMNTVDRIGLYLFGAEE